MDSTLIAASFAASGTNPQVSSDIFDTIERHQGRKSQLLRSLESTQNKGHDSTLLFEERQEQDTDDEHNGGDDDRKHDLDSDFSDDDDEDSTTDGEGGGQDKNDAAAVLVMANNNNIPSSVLLTLPSPTASSAAAGDSQENDKKESSASQQEEDGGEPPLPPVGATPTSLTGIAATASLPFALEAVARDQSFTSSSSDEEDDDSSSRCSSSTASSASSFRASAPRETTRRGGAAAIASTSSGTGGGDSRSSFVSSSASSQTSDSAATPTTVTATSTAGSDDSCCCNSSSSSAAGSGGRDAGNGAIGDNSRYSSANNSLSRMMGSFHRQSALFLPGTSSSSSPHQGGGGCADASNNIGGDDNDHLMDIDDASASSEEDTAALDRFDDDGNGGENRDPSGTASATATTTSTPHQQNHLSRCFAGIQLMSPQDLNALERNDKEAVGTATVAGAMGEEGGSDPAESSRNTLAHSEQELLQPPTPSSSLAAWARASASVDPTLLSGSGGHVNCGNAPEGSGAAAPDREAMPPPPSRPVGEQQQQTKMGEGRATAPAVDCKRIHYGDITSAGGDDCSVSSFYSCSSHSSSVYVALQQIKRSGGDGNKNNNTTGSAGGGNGGAVHYANALEASKRRQRERLEALQKERARELLELPALNTSAVTGSSDPAGGGDFCVSFVGSSTGVPTPTGSSEPGDGGKDMTVDGVMADTAVTPGLENSSDKLLLLTPAPTPTASELEQSSIFAATSSSSGNGVGSARGLRMSTASRPRNGNRTGGRISQLLSHSFQSALNPQRIVFRLKEGRKSMSEEEIEAGKQLLEQRDKRRIRFGITIRRPQAAAAATPNKAGAVGSSPPPALTTSSTSSSSNSGETPTSTSIPEVSSAEALMMVLSEEEGRRRGLVVGGTAPSPAATTSSTDDSPNGGKDQSHKKRKRHYYHRIGGRYPSTIHILLLEPVQKLFEIVPIDFVYDMTVGDILAKVRTLVTDAMLAQNTYGSLINTDGQEVAAPMVPARHLFVPMPTRSSSSPSARAKSTTVMLTAVPTHSHARVCHAATMALLSHPLVRKALRAHAKQSATMGVPGRTSPKKMRPVEYIDC